MVAKPNRIAEARKAIQQALAELVKGYKGSRMHILENEWGHLSVVIGSDRFRNLEDDDRDDLVWKHLRTTLDPGDFGRLSEVTVLDCDEYKSLLELDETVNRFSGDPEGFPQDFAL